MDEITIHDIPFKTLLLFFEGQEEIEIHELGDTCHPADGFVNEFLFKNFKTVKELLHANYDFRGLIIFKGRIGPYIIDYNGENYKIRGIKKEIEKFNNCWLTKVTAGNTRYKSFAFCCLF